jgi:hypothetical protein
MTLILRLNQEIRAPRLYMHIIDRTQHHLTSDHLATEYSTCTTIPDLLHQVSYSCHDPHRCLPCRTCYLHTMRQANMILHTKQE